MKAWTKEQIDGHESAARKLSIIMDSTFICLSKNKKQISEYEVQQFVISQFKASGLVSDSEPPIVAFGKNTQHVHYFPSESNCSKLKEGDLVMIDIWAREDKAGMPFADITFMGFVGYNLTAEEREAFKLVIRARDNAICFIKEKLRDGNLPILEDIDLEVRKVFRRHEVETNFLHTTGHSLGFNQAHGDRSGVIGLKNKNRLSINQGYTIEPGLYFQSNFGVRSEIDFYINDNMDFVLTSNLQKSLINL
jgi:Xaa-Pro aminopeptidase